MRLGWGQEMQTRTCTCVLCVHMSVPVCCVYVVCIHDLMPFGK